MKFENADSTWTNSTNQKDEGATPPPKAGTKRSRITRACDICRRKKIKCDIDDSHQCSTCKQYGWECTFNDTTKKRGPPKGYIESLETRLRKMEELLEKMQPESEADTTTTTNTANTMNKTEYAQQPKQQTAPSVEIPKSVEHSKVSRFLGSSSGYYLVRNILSTEEEEIDEIKPSRRTSSSITEDVPHLLRFKKINVQDDDILCVRDKTLEEHVEQLETDKLDLNPNIAPDILLNKLIQRFFRMNHASLPVVDKKDFLDAYEGRTQPPPAPILIYAICSQACILIPKDDALFKDLGLDRDELFDALAEHTSKLVKKEYLTPRFATIQALILLCGYPTSHKSFCRNWIRAGMAVRMAQELGLHRTLEKLPLTEQLFEARKRLWYCVYITDRWVCAVVGRPLAISDADCDIDLPHEKGGSKGTEDYSLFINFIKLSGILGEVLRRIYSPKVKSQGYNNIGTYHTVQSIHHMLRDWREQLPDHQSISTREAESFYANNIKTNKLTEAGPLMLCYHAVIILLYRSFILEKLDAVPELYNDAIKRCTEAAKNIVDIARLLNPFDIVTFGWNFAGYALFQASLIHVYNCTSNNPEVARQAKHYIRVCLDECMKPLGEQTSNASYHALPLISTIMDLTGISQKTDSNTTAAPSKPNTTSDASLRLTAPFKAAGSNDNNSDNNNNNGATFLQPNSDYQQQPVQQPSPMSVNAILSNWNDTQSNNDQAFTNSNFSTPAPQLAPTVEFSANNVPSATWQTLFSSAATPFFDVEADWQNALSALFEDNQAKQ